MKKTKDGYIPSKGVEYVTQNKLRVTIYVMIIYLGIMGGVCYWFKCDWEQICYISQIISGVFVVGGLVVSILQYTASNVSNAILRDQEKKIRAAEMANEFRKTVIPLISKLSLAYSDEEIIRNVLERLEDAQLTHFNREEIKRVFPENSYVKLRAHIAQHYACEVNADFAAKDKKYRTAQNMGKEEKENLAQELREELYSYVQEVGALCAELANLLEYMCICFNTNIADDTTVYQSLHKAFFQGVHMIYIFTFDVNENEHDRLFYNIMVLYKKWKETYNLKKNQEEQLKTKMQREVDSIKDKYREGITVKPSDVI